MLPLFFVNLIKSFYLFINSSYKQKMNILYIPDCDLDIKDIRVDKTEIENYNTMWYVLSQKHGQKAIDNRI